MPVFGDGSKPFEFDLCRNRPIYGAGNARFENFGARYDIEIDKPPLNRSPLTRPNPDKSDRFQFGIRRLMVLAAAVAVVISISIRVGTSLTIQVLFTVYFP